MAYCALDDLRAAVPEANLLQLTDDGGLGVIDQGKIDAACAAVDALIDGYLRGRYTVPLSPVPELIKRLAVDLAIYQLYSRRLELEMPQAMSDRRAAALRVLEHIQQGKVTLGIEPSEGGPGPGTYRTSKTTEDRVFNREKLDAY